ncbi:hypothetical protein [Microbacterium allomyrinae]|uniref:Arsenate reductase n=1 Tax=Microbacterium allomyrinae TaxID=2830666 RepID=A0A9X1S1N9_9MICO|nr:hypothetical protein [Microbacterium allomyrinae]MCC2031064.1 hypothetical protein [Microbacterium allomyrinae]
MSETSALNWAPAACTLPTTERPLRVAEFDHLFRTSARQIQRISPTRARVVFDPAAEAKARDLAARESSCCTFFDFIFTDAADGLRMDITVPDNQTDVLGALLAITSDPVDD